MCVKESLHVSCDDALSHLNTGTECTCVLRCDISRHLSLSQVCILNIVTVDSQLQAPGVNR